MLRKINKSNSDYVELPQRYMRKAFNSRYDAIIKDAEDIGLIAAAPYGVNGKGEFIYSSKDACLAKRFAFLDDYMLHSPSIFEEKTHKQTAEQQDIKEQIKSLFIDSDLLLAKIPEFADKRADEIVVLTDEKKFFNQIYFSGKKLRKVSFKAAKLIADNNNCQVLKDGDNYAIAKLEEYKQLKRKRSLFFNKMNLEKLIQGDYNDIKRNDNNRRLDYIFTNMSKELLNLILFLNKKVEIDLASAQFTLFSNILLLTINNFNSKDISYIKYSSCSSNHTCTHYVSTFLSNHLWMSVSERFKNTFSNFIAYYVSTSGSDEAYYVSTFLQELNCFAQLCFEGKLYQFISTTLDIPVSDAKTLMMEIFFSSDKYHSTQKKELKKLFPWLIKFIDFFKKVNGDEYVKINPSKKSNGCFPVALQQLEAAVFIDTLLPALRDHGLYALPKHDSLIVDAEKYDEAMEIITSILDGIGFRYHFKPKEDKENIQETTPTAQWEETVKIGTKMKIENYLKSPKKFDLKEVAKASGITVDEVREVKKEAIKQSKTLEYLLEWFNDWPEEEVLQIYEEQYVVNAKFIVHNRKEEQRRKQVEYETAKEKYETKNYRSWGEWRDIRQILNLPSDFRTYFEENPKLVSYHEWAEYWDFFHYDQSIEKYEKLKHEFIEKLELNGCGTAV